MCVPDDADRTVENCAGFRKCMKVLYKITLQMDEVTADGRGYGHANSMSASSASSAATVSAKAPLAEKYKASNHVQLPYHKAMRLADYLAQQ